METSSVIDKRQERSKKQKGARWLSWLCHPGTLRLLIGLGRLLDAIVRLLYELSKWLRS